MENLTEHIDAIEKERNEFALELARSVIARRDDAREDFDAAEKRLSSERLELSVMRERNSILEAGANKLAKELELAEQRMALQSAETHIGPDGMFAVSRVSIMLREHQTFLSAILEAADGATDMSDAELRARIQFRPSGPSMGMTPQTRRDLLKRFARTE